MTLSLVPAAEFPTADEQRFLKAAVDYLEQPSFLIRLTNVVGKPAEALIGYLPQRAQDMVADVTASALRRSFDWAVRTLPPAGAAKSQPPSMAARSAGRLSRIARHWHTAAAATTGAVGGFFGLPGMAMEIPATTTIMLRSIAMIAAECGADLGDPAVRLQCLSVFSYGSPALEGMESAYFTSRLGMAMAVKDAAAYVARHTAREVSEAVTKETAPALVRLLGQIASRFEIVVSQKLAAQAVPIAGAATGALINAAFTDHFNRVAEFHFGIVRLEGLHGKEKVQAAYQNVRKERGPKQESCDE